MHDFTLYIRSPNIMIMEQFLVRKASLADLDILYDFEQKIIGAERPFDVTLDKDPISYYDLRELMGMDTAIVLLAESRSKVIGSGFAHIREAKPYLDHRYYAHLGFMYTDPDYRGRGVNKAVVSALMDWCRSKKIAEVRLTVYNDNASAIKAYEKAGFKGHILEMRANLDEEK